MGECKKLCLERLSEVVFFFFFFLIPVLECLGKITSII